MHNHPFTMFRSLCLAASLLFSPSLLISAPLDLSAPSLGEQNTKEVEPSISASATASVLTYKKGESFYLSCSVTATDTWHSYYRNPGTIGEAPTIQWKQVKGFKMEGPYWKIPQLGQNTFSHYYGYSVLDFVWKVTPDADAPAEVQFNFSPTVSVCNDTGCSPPLDATASLTLKEGDGAANPEWKEQQKTAEVLGDTPLSLEASIISPNEIQLFIQSDKKLEGLNFISDDNIIALDKPRSVTAGEKPHSYVMSLPLNKGDDDFYPLAEELQGKSPSALKGFVTWKEGTAK